MAQADSSEPRTVYLNGYSPPDHRYTPHTAYDINFKCHVPITNLRSSRVELRPLIPSLHVKVVHEHWHDIANVQAVHGVECPTLASRFDFFEKRRKSQSTICFAIFVDPKVYDPLPENAPKPFHDPSASGEAADWIFAGHCSIELDQANLSCSYGINVLSQLGRQGVASHATALMLDWSLRLHDEGGLGARRCEWFTQSYNIASQKTALKLGFTFEGVKRYSYVVHTRMAHAGNGLGRPQDEQWPKQSWNEHIYSITCDDWDQGGVRDKLRSIIKM